MSIGAGTTTNATAYDRLELVIDSRPTDGHLIILSISSQGFIELHGDRRYADDPAIVGGIARA